MVGKKANIIKIVLAISVTLGLIVFPVIVKTHNYKIGNISFKAFANENWLTYYGGVLVVIATLIIGLIAYSLNHKILKIYKQSNNINEYARINQEKTMKAYLKIDEKKSECEFLDDKSILVHLCLENLTSNIITDITYESSDLEFEGTDYKNDKRPQTDKYLFIKDYISWSGGSEFNLDKKFESNFNISGFENIDFVLSFKATITSIYGYITEQHYNVHFMKMNDKYLCMGYKTIADPSHDYLLEMKGLSGSETFQGDNRDIINKRSNDTLYQNNCVNSMKGVSGTPKVEECQNINDTVVNDKDSEQRRSNRLVTVIGLMAVIGTSFSLTFRALLKVINVWPTKGCVYQYMQILMSILVTSLLIVIFNAVAFCFNDLQRYNIKSKYYLLYDEKSDTSFSGLIWYSKFCIWICIFGMASIFLVITYIDKNIYNTCLRIFLLIILSICIIGGIKYLLKRKHLWGPTKTILINILVFAFIGFFIYVISLSIIISNKSLINVSYKNNGVIEICDESSSKNVCLYIEITDKKGDLIWSEKIDNDDLMKAQVDKYVGGDIDENGKQDASGILINNQVIYTKYSFDINNLLDTMGSYDVYIIVEDDGEAVKIKNAVDIQDKCTFTKEYIEKEY